MPKNADKAERKRFVLVKRTKGYDSGPYFRAKDLSLLASLLEFWGETEISSFDADCILGFLEQMHEEARAR